MRLVEGQEQGTIMRASSTTCDVSNSVSLNLTLMLRVSRSQSEFCCDCRLRERSFITLEEDK